MGQTPPLPLLKAPYPEIPPLFARIFCYRRSPVNYYYLVWLIMNIYFRRPE